MDGVLTGVLLLPLVVAGLLMLVPKAGERSALVGAALTLMGAVVLGVWPGGRIDGPWIEGLGARFALEADGYSAALIAMSALLTLLAMAAHPDGERTRGFYVFFLLQQFAVTGVFLARDFLLFFFFFELSLLPMYFVIGRWGGSRRAYAANKFLIYTVLGSVLILVAGLVLHAEHGRQTGEWTFGLEALAGTELPEPVRLWVFLGLITGFAIKIPLAPFHTWLPDAHVEAPTAGSVVLAGILLKVGTYGMTRFGLPLVPELARDPRVAWWLGVVAIVAVVYGAFLCLTQGDWKKLIAYSSVSHMGLAMLGLFALNREGMLGSMLEQVNHGLSTPLLFLLAGFAYERRKSRQINDFGGLWKTAPVFCAIFLIGVLSSMGAPPLNGLMGEVPILQGAWRRSPVWALAGIFGLIVGVGYLLWLYQRVVMGEGKGPFADLTLRERWICAPLVALIVVLGVYPQPLMDRLEGPAAQVLSQISKLPPVAAAPHR